MPDQTVNGHEMPEDKKDTRVFIVASGDALKAAFEFVLLSIKAVQTLRVPSPATGRYSRGFGTVDCKPVATDTSVTEIIGDDALHLSALAGLFVSLAQGPAVAALPLRYHDGHCNGIIYARHKGLERQATTRPTEGPPRAGFSHSTQE